MDQQELIGAMTRSAGTRSFAAFFSRAVLVAATQMIGAMWISSPKPPTEIGRGWQMIGDTLSMK
jgi:hypothetical protein